MSQQPDTYTVNEIHFMPASSNRLFVDKSDATKIIAGKDAEVGLLRGCVEQLKRKMGDEIARNNPLRALAKSQEERIAYLAANCRGLGEARATLESERAANEQLTERVAELEFSWAGCSQQLKDACADLDEAEKRIAAQTDALVKARALIDAFLIANDPSEFGCACHPGESYICGPCQTDKRQIGLRKALAAIDAALGQFDRPTQPARDRDNAIYQSLASNYGKEKKEPEKTCMNCGTSGCDHSDAMRCANGRSLWEPKA